jgi:hypothetical protein
MSLPVNTERPSIAQVKGVYNNVFNNLTNNFNQTLASYRQISALNDKTTQALSTGQKLLRNVSLRNGELSNEIKDQVGILDTKYRKLELTEEDINLNQNIIKTLYILLIGIAISIIIMIVSFFMKLGNGTSSLTTTSSSDSSQSLFGKIGSFFSGTKGPAYKGNLVSSDSGATGNLFKIGGKK